MEMYSQRLQDQCLTVQSTEMGGMCTLRYLNFGIRVSVSEKSGINDLVGKRKDGKYGVMSGSCELSRESISDDLIEKLSRNGIVAIPITKEDIHLEKLENKVCQQYATLDCSENVILLDTIHIKLMTSYYPIDKLRKLKELENAMYIDLLSDSNGN